MNDCFIQTIIIENFQKCIGTNIGTDDSSYMICHREICYAGHDAWWTFHPYVYCREKL